MDVKGLVLSVLAIILAAIYSAIKAKNPDLPITQSDFVELLLWIAASGLSGWKAKGMLK